MSAPAPTPCSVTTCDEPRVHRLFCYPCWQRAFVLRLLGLAVYR